MRARTPRNQFGVYLVSSVVSQLVCCIFATRQPLVAQNVSTLTPLVSRAAVCVCGFDECVTEFTIA